MPSRPLARFVVEPETGPRADLLFERITVDRALLEILKSDTVSMQEAAARIDRLYSVVGRAIEGNSSFDDLNPLTDRACVATGMLLGSCLDEERLAALRPQVKRLVALVRSIQGVEEWRNESLPPSWHDKSLEVLVQRATSGALTPLADWVKHSADASPYNLACAESLLIWMSRSEADQRPLALRALDRLSRYTGSIAWRRVDPDLFPLRIVAKQLGMTSELSAAGLQWRSEQ